MTATMASAQNVPSDIKITDGVLTDPTGRALYTYDMDTMRGMSHCVGQCARAWPPMVAGSDAQPGGDWTIIVREDGKRQWVYKNKPLYYFSRDLPGKPPVGGANENWRIAHQ